MVELSTRSQHQNRLFHTPAAWLISNLQLGPEALYDALFSLGTPKARESKLLLLPLGTGKIRHRYTLCCQRHIKSALLLVIFHAIC